MCADAWIWTVRFYVEPLPGAFGHGLIEQTTRTGSNMSCPRGFWWQFRGGQCSGLTIGGAKKYFLCCKCALTKQNNKLIQIGHSCMAWHPRNNKSCNGVCPSILVARCKIWTFMEIWSSVAGWTWGVCIVFLCVCYFVFPTVPFLLPSVAFGSWLVGGSAAVTGSSVASCVWFCGFLSLWILDSVDSWIPWLLQPLLLIGFLATCGIRFF